MQQTSIISCDAFSAISRGMSLALIPKNVLKRVPPGYSYVICNKTQRLPLRQRRLKLVHTQHRSGHLSGNPLKFARTNSCAQEEKRSRRPRAKRLVQGSIPSSATTFNDGFTQPSYPTVVQQARNNINSFENCVILTRVGSFYEVNQAKHDNEACLITFSCTSNKLSNMHQHFISSLRRSERQRDQLAW